MEERVYIKKLKEIHEVLLDYLSNENNEDQDFNDFIANIPYQDILENKQELKDFLYLISRVSLNYHRYYNLISKIEHILLKFKTEIMNNFSNLEIFHIFEKDKKLLLFLFNEKIIISDRSIFNIISDYKHSTMNYATYFYLEFKDFFDKPPITYSLSSFEKKRKNHEKDIEKIIQKDLIDEFVIYINKNNISCDSYIKGSIFETNPLLHNKNISLIQYATFYGSIQIFNYLRLNGIELDSSLWIYAIHGKNPELFHLLEENSVDFDNETKIECLKESIKCHHNEFTEYIQNQLSDKKNDTYEYLIYKLKHYNYLSLPEEIFELPQFFFYFCKYDYFHIVNYLLNNNSNKIDVNMIQYKKNDNKQDGYIEIYDEYSRSFNIANFYEEENTPLCAAIKKGNKEIVNLLLKHEQIDVNKPFTTKYQILHDGTPSYEGSELKTPLFIAAENEYLEIVQLLYKHKNININDTSLCKEYSKEIGGIYCGKTTPLFIAIEKQNIKIVECLLNDENIDINYILTMELLHLYYYKKTVLHIAIEKNNEKLVKLLLSKQINQSIDYKEYEFVMVCDAPCYFRDILVKSSLQLAIQHKNIKIIELLLKNEKNINKYDCEAQKSNHSLVTYKAALHMAVENNFLDITKLLLSSKNIDVNLQAHYCNDIYQDDEHCCILQIKTPLFIAIENNNEQMVQLLLNQKDIVTDVKLTWSLQSCHKYDHKTRTVLDFANEQKNEKIINLLNKKKI